MITINGQKMGKSLNNFITLEELFSGKNPQLEKAYSPMTIRFFILQAHYRSTLDFSNEALQAAETGLQKMLAAMKTLQFLTPTDTTGDYAQNLLGKCYEAMNDDLNSPILIAHLFDGVRVINSVKEGLKTINQEELTTLKEIFQTFATEILGLKDEAASESNYELIDGLVKMLLQMRQEAKLKKDFQASDKIRAELTKLGIVVKDTKDGSEWGLKNS
jgi:cysteinyl-tRNA synthetase